MIACGVYQNITNGSIEPGSIMNMYHHDRMFRMRVNHNLLLVADSDVFCRTGRSPSVSPIKRRNIVESQESEFTVKILNLKADSLKRRQQMLAKAEELTGKKASSRRRGSKRNIYTAIRSETTRTLQQWSSNSSRLHKGPRIRVKVPVPVGGRPDIEPHERLDKRKTSSMHGDFRWNIGPGYTVRFSVLPGEVSGNKTDSRRVYSTITISTASYNDARDRGGEINPNNDFGENLKHLMDKAGKSVKDLADDSGISEREIRRLRNSHTNKADLRNIIAICISLHLNSFIARELVASAGYTLRFKNPEECAYDFLLGLACTITREQADNFLKEENLDPLFEKEETDKRNTK